MNVIHAAILDEPGAACENTQAWRGLEMPVLEPCFFRQPLVIGVEEGKNLTASGSVGFLAEGGSQRGQRVFSPRFAAALAHRNLFGTGRYLDYVCDELVPFIDARYPTLSGREHRGVSGKSSGGYGAIVLSMLRPA